MTESEQEVLEAKKLLDSGDIDGAVEILDDLFETFPGELVLLAKERAILVIRELPEDKQPALVGALETTIGYPVFSQAASVTTKQHGNRTVRYTRNDAGDLIEVCLVGDDGAGTLPFLLLDATAKKGMIRFRSTSDTFSEGKAVAATAHGDASHEAQMSFEQWRDKMIAWFEND